MRISNTTPTFVSLTSKGTEKLLWYSNLAAEFTCYYMPFDVFFFLMVNDRLIASLMFGKDIVVNDKRTFLIAWQTIEMNRPITGTRAVKLLRSRKITLI